MVGGEAAFPADSAGHIFFVKGTGERIRELRAPELAGCVLRIDDEAKGYHILWGGRGKADYQPTSEFISHVEIVMDKQRSGKKDRCVVHTHPLELIALSHHPKYAHDEAAYTHACWKMLPEVRAFVPRTASAWFPTVCRAARPSPKAPQKKLRQFDVAVWEKHGAVATGSDALTAYDFIDVATRAPSST